MMRDLDEFEESKKKYKKWENSLEGILYCIKTIGECDVEEEKYTILIAKTLQRIPKKMRDKVLSKVMFFQITGYGTVGKLYIPVPPKTKIVEQYYIFLNFSLMKNEKGTESYMMDTVAHEVAHFILGHYRLNPDGHKMDERHADDLIEKWGFKRIYKEAEYKWFEKHLK